MLKREAFDCANILSGRQEAEAFSGGLRAGWRKPSVGQPKPLPPLVFSRPAATFARPQSGRVATTSLQRICHVTLIKAVASQLTRILRPISSLPS